ncbi:MAG: YdcF family protein [Actinomycetota bacterium]
MPWLRSLWARRPVRWAVWVVLLITGLGPVAALLLTLDGLTDSARRSDVVVVLGNEVLDDGTPSDRLAARLDVALDVHDRGLADHVIVSGGVGRSGWDEAEVMAAYLVDSGIDAERIVIDSDGVNTRATAVNTARIMDEQQWQSAIVATQFYHISRSRLALRQEGVEEVTTAGTGFIESRDVFGLGREVVAYGTYLLRLR